MYGLGSLDKDCNESRLAIIYNTPMSLVSLGSLKNTLLWVHVFTFCNEFGCFVLPKRKRKEIFIIRLKIKNLSLQAMQQGFVMQEGQVQKCSLVFIQ